MTLPSGETSNNDEYDTALSQALNGNNTQLDSLSQAPFDDTDEPNENQQSLFDGVAMFDAAKKSKMVLNLFIFDKDGNEIGGDDDEPTNQKTPQEYAIDEVTKIRTPSANGAIGKMFIIADDKSWWSNGHFMVLENSDNVKTDKKPTVKPAFALDIYKNATNWNAIQLFIDSIGESSMGTSLVRLVGQEQGSYTGQWHEFGKYADQKYLSFLIKRFGKDVQFFTKSSDDKDPIYIAKDGKMVALLMAVAITMNTQFKESYKTPSVEAIDEENKNGAIPEMTAPSNETHRLNSTITSSVTENSPIVNAPSQESKPMTTTAEPTADDEQSKLDRLTQIALNSEDNSLVTVKLSVVDEKEAEKLKQATGLDLQGYTHEVDNYSIKHAFKQHGDQVQEESRGQIAITADDIALIPDIIKNYDTVEYADKNKIGRDTIKFSKAYNNTIYYVEEVRDGKKGKRLTMQTIYKRKGSVSHTSETFSAQNGTPSAIPLNQNIPSTDKNINSILSAEPQTAYNQADVDYLQQMANGEIALTVESMSEHIAKIEQIAERLGDEHESLIEQAVDKYSEFALSVQVN